jgi:hypothetical protein
MLLLITRTLYGVCFTCRVLNELFPPSVFKQIGVRNLGVLYDYSIHVVYGPDEGFLGRWKATYQ